MTLVHGVGINDSPYPVGGGKTLICPYYATWKRMLQRTYSKAFHATNPSYANTSVFAEWLRFSVFSEWMQAQAWEGMQLDKDLRKWGNLEYSPDACAFVPSRINSLLLDCHKRQGALPTGVYLVPTAPATPYRARVSNGKGGHRHLGYFASPEDAHVAWCKGKAASIFDALDWWRSDQKVLHTFNQEVAGTLIRFAMELLRLQNKDLIYVC